MEACRHPPYGKDGNEWPGTYTMVAGIIFQLVSLCIFAILFQCVMFRAIAQIMRDPHRRNLCIAKNLSIVFLLIRGVSQYGVTSGVAGVFVHP